MFVAERPIAEFEKLESENHADLQDGYGGRSNSRQGQAAMRLRERSSLGRLSVVGGLHVSLP